MQSSCITGSPTNGLTMMSRSLARSSALMASQETSMDDIRLLRIPLSQGEFTATWPEAATSGELLCIAGMALTVLKAWATHADRLEAGEAEYRSWFVAREKDTKGTA